MELVVATVGGEGIGLAAQGHLGACDTPGAAADHSAQICVASLVVLNAVIAQENVGNLALLVRDADPTQRAAIVQNFYPSAGGILNAVTGDGFTCAGGAEGAGNPDPGLYAGLAHSVELLSDDNHEILMYKKVYNIDRRLTTEILYDSNRKRKIKW